MTCSVCKCYAYLGVFHSHHCSVKSLRWITSSVQNLPELNIGQFKNCCVECTSRSVGRVFFLFSCFPPDSTWVPSCWRGNNDRPGSAQVEENKARRGKQSTNNIRKRRTGRRKLQACRKDGPHEQNHLLPALTSSSAKLQGGGFACKMVPS